MFQNRPQKRGSESKTWPGLRLELGLELKLVWLAFGVLQLGYNYF